MTHPPTTLFPWLREVTALAADGVFPFDSPHHSTRTKLLAFAVEFALTCRRTTGEGCWLAPSLRTPRRTANRYMAALVDAGLVTQTERPTRGQLGKPGRSARYALTLPAIVGHDYAQGWPTIATTKLAHDSDSHAQAGDGEAPTAEHNVGQLRAGTVPGIRLSRAHDAASSR